MKQKLITKFSSWVVWMGILSQATNIALLLGVEQGKVELWRLIIISILEIFALFGFINNPDTRKEL